MSSFLGSSAQLFEQTTNGTSMKLTGNLLIGQCEVAGVADDYRAFDPTTGQALEPAFSAASPADVDRAAFMASKAFDAYRATSVEQRATFLESIASGIEGLGPLLIDRAAAETALPRPRLEGERSRTGGQLRLFGRVLRSGLWQQATVDTALPDRQPARRPDLRARQIAIGPVAIFGASNFPLAFSVAGGDTASALAAGCPVIVKVHPSHPGTSELVGRVIQRAVQICGLPEGTFSMIGGTSNQVGERLVSHPAVQAVGFTGSRRGGLALCRIARDRSQPIPVYAEMSSINPVFLMPAALAARANTIATEYIDSLLLGSGQFCTNPGLVLGIAGAPWNRFVADVAGFISKRPAGTLLNASIKRAYEKGNSTIVSIRDVRLVGHGQSTGDGYSAQPVVYETTARVFAAEKRLHEEVFGPCGLLVRCEDLTQMLAIADEMEGQLTATLQLDPSDHAAARRLIPVLERKVGRIVVNNFPTGVEVSHAMVHGGPFPATSDSRSTSVGARAIDRFLRPVVYQDMPSDLLPSALQPIGTTVEWRLVDGELIHSRIERLRANTADRT